MEDIVCHSPSYEHFPRPNNQHSSIECNNRQSNPPASELSAKRGDVGQEELGSKVFSLLEPAMQSYSDPSIIEWYKSRDASPESDRYPTSKSTSNTAPAPSTRIQLSPNMYSQSIDFANRPSGSPDAGRSGALVSQQQSSTGSRGMESDSTKRLSIQSLLSPERTDDRPLKDHPAASRLGRNNNNNNIEDLILDGLTWLSSCAP